MVFLPIIIPPQQKLFKLFLVVGWVVAIAAHAEFSFRRLEKRIVVT